MSKRLTVKDLAKQMEEMMATMKAQHEEQMKALKEQNAALTKRVAELEARPAVAPAPVMKKVLKKKVVPAPVPAPAPAPAPVMKKILKKKVVNYTFDVSLYSPMENRRTGDLYTLANVGRPLRTTEMVAPNGFIARETRKLALALPLPKNVISEAAYWEAVKAGRAESDRKMEFLLKLISDHSNFKQLFANIGSHTVMLRVSNLKEVGELPQHQPSEVVVKDAIAEGIAHRFVNFDIKADAGTIEEAFLNVVEGVENACGPNMLMQVYGPSFEKHGIPLSFETIATDIGGFIDGFGMTLQQLVAWTSKYGIKLTSFNVKGQMLADLCTDGNRNKHIRVSPSHLCVILHGNHVYLASAIQTRGWHNRAEQLQEALDMNLDDIEGEESKPITTDFVAPSHIDSVFLDNIDELPRVFGEWLEEAGKKDAFRVAYSGDLNALLYRLVFACHYEPQIHCEMGQLMSIRIRSHEKTIVIANPHKTPADVAPVVDNAEEHALYGALMDKWNNIIYAPECVSTYSPSVTKFVTKLHGAPATFLKNYAGVYTEIDTCKAYTSFLLKFKHLPVFNITDEFRPYAGQPLQEYAFYHVEAEHMHGAEMALYRGRTNVFVGLVLKDLVEAGIVDIAQVKAVLLPYRLVSLKPVHELVQELWKSDLSVAAKKAFINTAIGTTGRIHNNKIRCGLYRDQSEAYHYKGSGCVLPLTAEGMDTKLYQVTEVEDTKQLTGGLRVLQSMIYSMQRFEAFTRWTALEADGHEILGVKVDAVFVKGDLSARGEAFNKNVFESIGKTTYKVHDAVLGERSGSVDFDSHTLAVPFPVREVLHLEDEYSDELVKMYGVGRKVLAVGAGGCGKTHGVLQYIKANPEKKVLICAPTHELIAGVNRRLRSDVVRGMHKVRTLKKATTWKRAYDMQFTIPENVTVITPHKLTRWMPCDRYTAPIDLVAFDVVVFDEIYSIPTDMTCRAIKMIEECTKPLEVYACGDWHQTQPRDSIQSGYRWAMIKQYFGETMVELLKNKRLAVDQRERMDTIIADIFDNGMYTPVAVKKHLKPTEEIVGACLSLTNETRKKVNIAQHAKAVAAAAHVVEVKGKQYYYQQQLLCKEPVKMEEGDIHRNAVVEIIDFQSGAFKVWNSQNDTIMKLPHALLGCFGLAYCRTVHSFQGASIDGAFTIMDWTHWHSDGHWLYTAISRCTDLDNVHFYTGTEFQPTAQEVFVRWCSRKANGYKTQDAKRGMREGDITTEWIMQQYNACGGCCTLCGCHMGCDGDTMMTVDRVNSSLPHDADNCVVACLRCNRVKRDMNVMR